MMVCNKDLRIIFKAVYMFLAGSVHFQVKIDISTTPWHLAQDVLPQPNHKPETSTAPHYHHQNHPHTPTSTPVKGSLEGLEGSLYKTLLAHSKSLNKNITNIYLA